MTLPTTLTLGKFVKYREFVIPRGGNRKDRIELNISKYFRIFSESNIRIRILFQNFRNANIDSELGMARKNQIFGIFGKCTLIIFFGTVGFFRNFVRIYYIFQNSRITWATLTNSITQKLFIPVTSKLKLQYSSNASKRIHKILENKSNPRSQNSFNHKNKIAENPRFEQSMNTIDFSLEFLPSNSFKSREMKA